MDGSWFYDRKEGAGSQAWVQADIFGGGYPLVSSHNVDRYHCPWDMGYDR